MSKKKHLLLLSLIFCFSVAAGQHSMALYEGAVINSIPSPARDQANADKSVFHRVVNPALTIYLPEGDNKKRTAVIICAGGGYAELNIKREGYHIAEAFNREGVAAFVLRYRLPDARYQANKTIAPLQDAQRAIQIVRDSAASWHIDPGKIGIMGFSAGGHLASSAGTHYHDWLIPNPSYTSLRPDFMLLVYPVISFGDAFGHIGSRNNLLGHSPSPDSIRYFSNELQVNKQTPPAFLVHAGDDRVVHVKNSIAFYEQLNQHGILSDLHIYAKGGHGFGAMISFEEWFGRCRQWMKGSGFIP